jgi:hypothetical protein
METTFTDLVDKILELPIDEKEEIKNIIDHSLTEEKRKKIHDNYLKSKEEEKAGKLKYSNKITELKKQL